MQNNISYIKLFFILLLAGMAFSSCSEDQDLANSNQLQGLGIGLQIGKPYEDLQSDATKTVASDNALNEDVINDLNVFFYDKDGNCVKYKYLNSDLASEKRSLIQSGDEWQKVLIPGTIYTVYAIANFGSELGSMPQTSLHRTITDINIYLPYNKDTNNKKVFLMDGKCSWTAPASGTVIIPMQLKRAATKVIVNLTFSQNMKDNVTDITGTWGLKSYATKAEMLDETTPTDYALQPFDVSKSIQLTNIDKNGTTSFTTYVFPNNWTDDPVANQTLIKIDLPCTFNGVAYPHNYYTVPIVDNNTTTAPKYTIGRNYIYTVNAVIDKPNSHDENEVPQTFYYGIRPWTTSDDINIGDNTSSKYLEVQPQTVIMKNVDTDKSVTYTSSSNITVTIERAYFKNKEGNDQDLITFNADGTIKSNPLTITAAPTTDDLRQGTITLTSKVPTNLGPRFILIKITNADGLSKEVLYKQYPLEYIIGIDGSYSYKDDLKDYPYYLQKGKDNGSLYHDDMFECKYYKEDNNNKHIYSIYGSNIYGFYAWDRNQGSQNNNQMYAVRITTTDSKYTIDKPTQVKDANGDLITEGSKANNDVVSPAFMLASQLGTVSVATWSEASDHCKKYVEVGTNGKKYDDWRLPTLAELSIICAYQKNTNQDVMITVLLGPEYWSAYHAPTTESYYEDVGKGNGSYSQADDEGYYYVGSNNGNYTYSWKNGRYRYTLVSTNKGDYKKGTSNAYYFVGQGIGSYELVYNNGYYKTGYDYNENYNKDNVGNGFTTDSSEKHYIRCIRDIDPSELTE